MLNITLPVCRSAFKLLSVRVLFFGVAVFVCLSGVPEAATQAGSQAEQAAGPVFRGDQAKQSRSFVPSICVPAALDPTFDVDGKTTTPIGGGQDAGLAIAIQTDGRILVGGFSHNGTNYDFAVARYNTDGSLDTSFDSDGKVTTPIGTGDDFILTVAIQSDGKIVAGGYSINGSDAFFVVARYNANGSLDTSWDGDGKVVTQVRPNFDIAYSIAIQSDGRIVAAGYSEDSSINKDFAVVRYNSNGSLDTSFDGDGIAITPVGSSWEIARSVAIQSDGRVVATGESRIGTAVSGDDFAVVRYNTDGSLDTSFDGDGKVITPVGSGQDVATEVTMQSDGRILVTGYGTNGSNNDFALVRYNTNGSLDTSFDGDGKVVTPIGTGDDSATSAAIQFDGKIIAAGFTASPDLDVAVVRYNADGSLDTSFDGDGKVVTPFGSGPDLANAVLIQPADGKIVAAGQSAATSIYDFAVVRYGADCPTAANASVSGRVMTSEGRGLRNATVIMTNVQGASRRAITGSFGYYRFDEVEAGQTYVIGVVSKRFVFTPRAINVNDDLTEVDLMAEMP